MTATPFVIFDPEEGCVTVSGIVAAFINVKEEQIRDLRDEVVRLRAGITPQSSSEPADITTRLMPIADEARKAGIRFQPFVDLAKKAYDRAHEASPDWHGPIDGEMTDEHFDRDERR